MGKLHRDGEAKLGGTVTRRAGLERSQVRAEGPVKAELLPKAGGEGYQESDCAGGGCVGSRRTVHNTIRWIQRNGGHDRAAGDMGRDSPKVSGK